MDTDIRIVAVLMFFLGVLVTFSLVRTFGDADASESEYYKIKDGVLYFLGIKTDLTEECSSWTYGREGCMLTKVVILQNEKIITLLEEVKNATRG